MVDPGTMRVVLARSLAVLAAACSLLVGTAAGLAGGSAASATVPSRVLLVGVASGARSSLGSWLASTTVSAVWGSGGLRVAEQASTVAGYGSGRVVSFSRSGRRLRTQQRIARGVQVMIAGDARTVALLSGGSSPRVVVEGPAGVQATFAVPGNDSQAAALTGFSPNGEWLAIQTGPIGHELLSFFDARTGVLLRSTPLPGVGVVDAIAFADNERLAAWVPDPDGLEARRTLQELDLRTGRLDEVLSLPGLQLGRGTSAAWISSPVFLPHRSTIAYVRDLNTVEFLPARGHEQIQPPDPSCNQIDAIAASPTGHRIALAYQAGDERLPIRTETVRADGHGQRPGPQLGPGNIDSLAYSPDSQQLLVAIGGVTDTSGPIPRCP
jgi:hypothetical protein